MTRPGEALPITKQQRTVAGLTVHTDTLALRDGIRQSSAITRPGSTTLLLVIAGGDGIEPLSIVEPRWDPVARMHFSVDLAGRTPVGCTTHAACATWWAETLAAATGEVAA